MLEAVSSSPTGECEVSFGSNTFTADWHLVWDEGGVQISADWKSVAGNKEDELRRAGPVRLAKEKLVSDWKALLSKVREGLLQYGVEFEDSENWEALERLLDPEA